MCLYLCMGMSVYAYACACLFKQTGKILKVCGTDIFKHQHLQMTNNEAIYLATMHNLFNLQFIVIECFL